LLQVEGGDLNGAYDHAVRFVHQRPDRSRSHFALAYMLRYAGLLEESARECDAALALDPADRGLRSCSLTFIQLGRYDRAELFARVDQGSEWSQYNSARLALYRGNNSQALYLYRQSPTAAGVSKEFVPAFLERRPPTELEALAQELERDMENARDSEQIYWTAADLSFGNQGQPALRLLRRAVEHNYCAYPVMDRDPSLAAVRRLPEYPALRGAGIACQQRFLAHRAELTR
jgi:tetratricopeptide (TPR) repeat protein